MTSLHYIIDNVDAGPNIYLARRLFGCFGHFRQSDKIYEMLGRNSRELVDDGRGAIANERNDDRL